MELTPRILTKHHNIILRTEITLGEV